MKQTEIQNIMRQSHDDMFEVVTQLPSPSQTNTEHVIEQIFDVLRDIEKKLLNESEMK